MYQVPIALHTKYPNYPRLVDEYKQNKKDEQKNNCFDQKSNYYIPGSTQLALGM
jgi:hypothetical protein